MYVHIYNYIRYLCLLVLMCFIRPILIAMTVWIILTHYCYGGIDEGEICKRTGHRSSSVRDYISSRFSKATAAHIVPAAAA